MISVCLICLLILVLFFIIIYYEYWTENEHFNTEKPIIWSYWENKPGKTRPEYIDLCYETFSKHNRHDFDIKILDEKTVYDYLPDLRKDINNLPLPQKSDYVRIALLYKYGGIWLDADTIVVRNLKPIIDKLNEGFDFIGFGCSYDICDKEISGFPKPSNQAQACKKNSKLVKLVLEKLDKKLNEKKNTGHDFGYFDLGKLVIWDALQELMKDKEYKYYHYNSSFDGSRDKSGHWINWKNHFSILPTEFLNQDDLFFVFLVNNKYATEYPWFNKLSRKQILNGPWWISQLLRKSLNEENKQSKIDQILQLSTFFGFNK